MKPVTLARWFLITVNSVIRIFVALSAGIAVLFGLAASAGAAAPAPKKKDPIFDKNRIHRISVFSYMQSMGGRGPSLPVLVTLNVKGPKALAEFCYNQPTVNEAVLSVLSRDQGKAGKKAILKSVKSPLRKAINRVLKGKPVRKINTRTGRTPAAFGPDLMKTRKACKAIQG